MSFWPIKIQHWAESRAAHWKSALDTGSKVSSQTADDGVAAQGSGARMVLAHAQTPKSVLATPCPSTCHIPTLDPVASRSVGFWESFFGALRS